MCCCLDFVCQRNNSHKLSLNNWVWQKLMICKIWPLSWIIQRLQKLFIIRYNSHLYTCCIKATFLCYTVIDVLYKANIFVAGSELSLCSFGKKFHFKICFAKMELIKSVRIHFSFSTKNYNLNISQYKVERNDKPIWTDFLAPLTCPKAMWAIAITLHRSSV